MLIMLTPIQGKDKVWLNPLHIQSAMMKSKELRLAGDRVEHVRCTECFVGAVKWYVKETPDEIVRAIRNM